MLKKFVSSLMVLLLLAGCGSTSGSGSTPEDVSKTIVDELKLGDKMEKVEDRVVNGLFFFDEGVIEESAVYIANDKTANVVGVFKTKDITSCEESVNGYLSTLKEQMENYYPDEVFKVDNAVVADNGSDRVVLIVADDLENAKSIAEKYLK